MGVQLDGSGERMHVFVVCVWSCRGLVAVMYVYC